MQGAVGGFHRLIDIVFLATGDFARRLGGLGDGLHPDAARGVTPSAVDEYHVLASVIDVGIVPDLLATLTKNSLRHLIGVLDLTNAS